MSGIEDANDLVAAIMGHAALDPSVYTRPSSPHSSLTTAVSRRKEFINGLPVLTEDDLTRLDQKDSCCPICFTSFLAVLASEEMAHAMDSPANAIEDLGVTRLANTCGHLFCRKDITVWISQNDSCPTCRRPFIVRPELADAAEPDQSDVRDPRYRFDIGISDMRSVSNLFQSPAFLAAARAMQGYEGEAADRVEDRDRNRNHHNGQDDGRDEFVGLYS
ncbi:hypothetical protein M0805_007389 [Coniferiporia weirii]|nr:hypothetical protein M0805_007389 [Coniferiporia weirii]